MSLVKQGRTDPVVLWQIRDEKRGHLSQSTGLVEALCRRAPLAVYQVPAPSSRQSLVSCLNGRVTWARGLPPPRIAVGAGHATHAALLAIHHIYRARTVVLMRPSLPLSWFDYCLVPAHDDPPARDNVIVTAGAINSMQAGQDHSPAHGLILVGGPSRHYRPDPPTLLCRIRRLLERYPVRYWTLSNSPRTPPLLTRELTRLETTRVEVVPWNRGEPGWLAGALARVRDAWITEDSISMIYEALTSGCHVGLLPFPRKPAGRLHRAIDRLLAEGFVHAYKDQDVDTKLPAPPYRPDEANRCAKLLLARGLLQGTAGPAPCR